VELEDNIKHGPGTILNYFSAMNYFDGVKILMEEPFLVSARTLNKLKMSALLIATHYNNTRVGMLLLQHGADPLISDSDGQTPLHMAIDKYTQSRAEETCNFIDALIEKGADPKAVDNSGETPAHMATKTLDFRVSSLFAVSERICIIFPNLLLGDL
jgi:ankyrin repeat protein